MRNGDYIPTRMEAQHDAANLLCGSKTNSNPESTVSESDRGVEQTTRLDEKAYAKDGNAAVVAGLVIYRC